MAKQKRLSEGEVLLILIHRSGMRDKGVAQYLKIHPGHLSKIKKDEVLSAKVKAAAAELFGVDVSVFESGMDYALPDLGASEVSEPKGKYERELSREDLISIIGKLVKQ